MKKSEIALLIVMSSWIPLIMSCDEKPEIEWIDIPSGTFTMGSPSGEEKITEDEYQHQVTLSSFRISKYEITVAQFRDFTNATGYLTDAETSAGGKSGCIIWPDISFTYNPGVNWRYDERGILIPDSAYGRPVIFVSWNDATAFADWMGCRLPTESEWEYACRAGTSTPFSNGHNLNTLYADYNGLYPYNLYDSTGLFREYPVSVDSFIPNDWGLYNMHGNVSEWCSDWYGNYPVISQKDPEGPERGFCRALRGGSWCSSALDCRSASRACQKPWYRSFETGFRIVAK